MRHYSQVCGLQWAPPRQSEDRREWASETRNQNKNTRCLTGLAGQTQGPWQCRCLHCVKLKCCSWIKCIMWFYIFLLSCQVHSHLRFILSVLLSVEFMLSSAMYTRWCNSKSISNWLKLLLTEWSFNFIWNK